MNETKDNSITSAPAVASSVGLGRHNMKITLEWNGETGDGKRSFIGYKEDKNLMITLEHDDCDKERAKKLMQEVIDRCNKFEHCEL